MFQICSVPHSGIAHKYFAIEKLVQKVEMPFHAKKTTKNIPCQVGKYFFPCPHSYTNCSLTYLIMSKASLVPTLKVEIIRIDHSWIPNIEWQRTFFAPLLICFLCWWVAACHYPHKCFRGFQATFSGKGVFSPISPCLGNICPLSFCIAMLLISDYILCFFTLSSILTDSY